MLIGVDGNEANVQLRVGSGHFSYKLLCEFEKIKNSFRVEVFLKRKPLNDLPKSFRYRVFGPAKFWTQIALPLNLFFGKPRPNVFFCPSHYAPRFSPMPVVITIFDLSFLHFPEMFRSSDLIQLISWTRYSVTKAKKILTISQHTKKDIVSCYNVDESKIAVAYPGVDDIFRPQSKANIDRIRKKYKINADYIIYVGTLQPRKNLIRLLEAFKILVDRERKFSSLKLVIAGKKGWLYDQLFGKIKKLGLEKLVIFTGYVSTSDLPPLLSGAKVFILPSLYEGFGIPVIEAQACGTPVIVSNTSSLPEIVGESGILVDPLDTVSIRDGIYKVLTDYNLRKKLIKDGLSNVKRFSWHKTAERAISLINEAAG